MFPVESPFKVFTDLEGTPLDNGFIYFGAPNDNPVTAPVPVYWDAAGTLPALQPLRTMRGYIMRTGTPANVFVNGTYSILVQDQKRQQVLLARDSSEFGSSSAFTAFAGDLAAASGASLVGFTQQGAGATALTVQDRLREMRTNLDFVPLAERAAILAGTSTYDATEAVQKAIDAAGSNYRLRWLGTVNTRALSSAASVDWEFEGAARVKQIPAAYGGGTWHVTLSGNRVHLKDAHFDGNQGAMTNGQGSNGLIVTGTSPTLINVTASQYNGRGYDCNSKNPGTKRGIHIGCSFDDNAGLGLMTVAASYLDFMGCTFDRNGYGFQGTRANPADTSHAFIAFGVALRMRSHHINMVSCHARDNGRDGFNVNQGSYAIKFAQCIASGNDDGGFTAASDDTGTGLPGESEGCYDLEYIGCDSYNNYGSGLSIYQSCANIRVLGGRYYNNHRLAGSLPPATSHYNGIFCAGGSSGINIDTNAYDDRQTRAVTEISGSTLMAAGWVPGTKDYYPKVAIHSGADQSFKGYAVITAEGAGSVTISPAEYNGIAAMNVGVGDYVTQAVQHNGVLIDNNCQGSLTIEGAGHRKGPQADVTGQLALSAGYANGQNVLLPREQRGVELLSNPSFDTDISGWTFDIPGGGQVAQSTAVRKSAASLRIIAGTEQTRADAVLVNGALQFVEGGFVEFSGWVYANARNDAALVAFWTPPGGGPFYTENIHPGGGWRFMKLGIYVPKSSTNVRARVFVNPGKTAYFDSMSMRPVDLHTDPREFTFPSRTLPV